MFDLAHIHVMIVHLPIMGTVLAMIPLLLWIYKRDISMKWIGLVILAVSLVAIPIATSSGESAQHAFRDGTITAQLDIAGQAALRIHSQAADFAEAFGYFILVLIVLQLYFWKKEYSWKNKLFLITIATNTVLIAWLGYVGYLGGQIRHPEFRTPVTNTTVKQATVAQ